MKSIMLVIIRGYQRYISPHKAPCCRFYPTCSVYAAQAIQGHGALRGGFLALKRILKCHPFHPGGYDPVPECGRGHSADCCGDTMRVEDYQ